MMRVGTDNEPRKGSQEADERLYLLVMRVVFQIFLLSRLRNEEAQEPSGLDKIRIGEAPPNKYLM